MKKIFDGYIMVSDMDGTLLNSSKVVSEKNKMAIKKFINNGGKFTLASGRMVQSVESFVDELDVNMPVILHNGAKIYDFSNGKTMVDTSIEDYRKNAIKNIKIDYPNIGIEIFVNEIVYIYQKCELTKRYEKYDYKIKYDITEEVWNSSWNKVLLIASSDELDEIEIVYRERYDKGTCYRSGENYLDIVGNGVNKGEALEQLIKMKNIDINKVIAVGDNMNDIEMLHKAKYGFHIKDGPTRALKNAKLIAPGKDQDPIEYIVNWLEVKINKEN